MRTILSKRKLPDYTRGEEIFNSTSHILGAAFSIMALLLCLIKSIQKGDGYGILSSLVYGVSMLVLYCMSSIYHGLRPSTGKKVLQILDHCAIYMMIAGTYTPIALCALRPAYPLLGWSILILEWGFAALAISLNAVDLKQFQVFSMICNLLMGWLVIFFMPMVLEVLGKQGFLLLLLGGISYTLGALLYGIGSKKRYFHSAFHVFVLLGSVFHFLSIHFFVL